jgi:hypothetical protein
LNRLVKTIAGFALAATGALTSLTPAEAHHSFAMYDTTKPTAVTGILTRTSPDAFHFQMFIAQLNMERTKVLRDKSGQPIIWVVELRDTAAVAATGITESSFPPGTIVSVGFYPLRDGKPGGTRNELGVYRCPDKTPPAAGKMCDSVAGSKPYGPGKLPATEATVAQ